jgi:S-layer protein (TIGR01567 family)
VNVGWTPYGVAISPDGNKAYVTNEFDVSVIDTTINNVTATVDVGIDPFGIAVTPDGKKVYVAIGGEDKVSVIDTCTNKVITTVPVGSSPRGVAITPDGKMVYVTNSGEDNVSVINTCTNKVIATVPVGSSPRGLAVTPDGKMVYVANFFSNNENMMTDNGTVSVIDTDSNRVQTTVTVELGPQGVAVTPDGKKVYVANQNDNNISVIDTDTNKVTATIPVGSYPIAFGQFIENTQRTLPLIADFTATPLTGNVPLKVTFADASTGSPTSWQWDFGDGSSYSTLQNPTHNYPVPGTYQVTLKVGFANRIDTITQPITVSYPQESSNIPTGNRIWEEGMPTTYTWNAQSFSGFYYDLETGVSSESMTIKDIGRSINEGDLQYISSPIVTKFDHNVWGTYQILGFMTDKYFAGYTDNSVPVTDNISPISNGILSKILIDSNDKKSVSSEESLALKEGYSLIVKKVDINGHSVLLDLEKDGKIVDDGFISANQNYVYKADLGKATDVPVILVHFGSVFSSTESSAVFVQGVFQISDNYIEVKNGDDFGEMEVKSISSDGIKMENSNDIMLSRGDTVNLMDKVKIKIADDNILRFAPIVDTSQASTYELRGTAYDEDIENNIPTWTPLNFERFYYNIDVNRNRKPFGQKVKWQNYPER